MAYTLPPPPFGNNVNDFVWKDWFNKLKQGLQSTIFSISQGGTGLSSLGTPNQVLGVNNGATALEYKSINSSQNVTITNAANSITVNASAGLQDVLMLMGA